MIHYAVTEGEYSCYHIVAIVSDKQKAENLAKIYDGEVEEYDDSTIRDDLVWYRFLPGYNFECDLMEYPDDSEPPSSGWADIVYLDEINLKAWRSFKGAPIEIWVRAKNQDVALKTAQDAYAFVKAQEEGV